ncbi:hypothetical protein IW262DRAFT_1355650 [Armillaria fumosa]|nr:hypothetical protein IW262DRAFT_1355650 [Armillaria fumosa]
MSSPAMSYGSSPIILLFLLIGRLAYSWCLWIEGVEDYPRLCRVRESRLIELGARRRGEHQPNQGGVCHGHGSFFLWISDIHLSLCHCS